MKITEIEEVNGAKIAIYTPQKSNALKEGINLTTGFVMEKHAVDYGDAWDECWIKARPATEEEKATILADLPKFQERVLKDKIFHAAYLVANWSEDVNFALKKYELSSCHKDEVLKIASEIAEDME